MYIIKDRQARELEEVNGGRIALLDLFNRTRGVLPIVERMLLCMRAGEGFRVGAEVALEYS